MVFNTASGSGSCSYMGTALELTDGGTGEARSAYYATKVNIAKFQTQFDFQLTDATADGFTFCIQRGTSTTTGGPGSYLGYGGVPNSIAIKFDIYNPLIPNVSTTGLYTNGTPPLDPIPPGIDVKGASGIDFHSGDMMQVLLTYVEGTLNEQITDLSTKAVFTQEYTINIPSTIGSPSNNPTAYVGFTAGTGGLSSTQKILNWTFNSAPPGVADVLMFHADPASTGQYLTETTLSATNVNSTNFGKLFSYTVDGEVFAQPLYKAGVTITSGSYKGTTHNVIYVATENDSLYAFDADGAAVTGPLWHASFITVAGCTAVPWNDIGIDNIEPVIGVTGTPVIDPTTNTIFVCSKTKEILSGVDHYVYHLHAIDITSGREEPGSPTLMADTIATLAGTGTNTVVTSFTYAGGPTVSGTGAGSVNGRLRFNALRQLQRPALNLVNGIVYISTCSHGDIPPYHGWVLGYNATTFQLTAAWNDTPNGTDGGIWQSGGGVISDSNGNLYVMVGNGTFQQPAYNSTTGSYVNGQYGDSFVKLAVDTIYSSSTNQNSNGWGLKVVDYFTPYNQLDMSEHDYDLGSGGPTLLPDSVGSIAHPHLLVGAGKLGTVYLLDVNKMGEYNTGGDSVVQEKLNGIGQSYDVPAYYNGAFYYCGTTGIGLTTPSPGNSFTISSGTFASSFSTPDKDGYPGGTVVISGSAPTDPNAIAWCVQNGVLRAYEAENFSKEIYTSNQAANSRDELGANCKFIAPIIASGRVYVPVSGGLVVYGLLP